MTNWSLHLPSSFLRPFHQGVFASEKINPKTNGRESENVQGTLEPPSLLEILVPKNT